MKQKTINNVCHAIIGVLVIVTLAFMQRYFSDDRVQLTYFNCIADATGICYEVDDGFDKAVFNSMDRYIGPYDMEDVMVDGSATCVSLDNSCPL